jgi:hypothetical protein
MGIHGLAARIKTTDGIEEDLTDFTCHVDCASMFFGLIHGHGFHKSVEFAAKSARRQASSRSIPSSMSTPLSTTVQKRPGADDTPLSRKRARVNPDSQTSPYNIVETMQDLLATQPPQIRFNQERLLETDIKETSTVSTNGLLNRTRVFEESVQ